ncbi:hypothetical protein FBY35_0270 [Streptomyces sp. SLBN-118]|nr:hypothetical protein FBY35_0270 [Streptomyces sp. SLBN-118]
MWLLGLAQRHLDRSLRRIGPAVSRSAYGAFIMRELVLIRLAVVLRPVPVPWTPPLVFADMNAVVDTKQGLTGPAGGDLQTLLTSALEQRG